DVLAVDAGDAGPLLAGAADAYRIADRLAVAQHVIEPALMRHHHDGARRMSAVELDHLARRGALRNAQHCGREHRRAREGEKLLTHTDSPHHSTASDSIESEVSYLVAFS